MSLLRSVLAVATVMTAGCGGGDSDAPKAAITIGGKQVTATTTAFLSTSTVINPSQPDACRTLLAVRGDFLSEPAPMASGFAVTKVSLSKDGAVVWTGTVASEAGQTATGYFAIARGCAPAGVVAGSDVTAGYTITYSDAVYLLSSPSTRVSQFF